MRLVFFGTGAIGLPSLHALRNSRQHEVVAVVTQPDKPAGRDLRPRESPVKQSASGLPVLQPRRVRESVEELKMFGADAFVVIAYGQLLPATVLGIPPLGCLNVHASLLPRHRGASPIHAALLAGDGSTGVTIMQMDEGLDTGDVLLARATPIKPDETCGELHDRLADLAVEPLIRVLDDLSADRAVRTPQDESLATVCGKLTKESGRVDWSRSTVEVDRMIRAMSPWPGAYTIVKETGAALKIHRAIPVCGERLASGHVRVSEGQLLVGTQDGAIQIAELQLPSRKKMLTADFLLGNRNCVGQVWE